MITINKTSRDFTPVEQYLMTASKDIKSLTHVDDDTHITVEGYMMFTDTKEETGETVELLSIITPDKTVYTAQSQTFKRDFFDMTNILGESGFTVIKKSGTTKSNRPFIYCVLDTQSC